MVADLKSLLPGQREIVGKVIGKLFTMGFEQEITDVPYSYVRGDSPNVEFVTFFGWSHTATSEEYAKDMVVTWNKDGKMKGFLPFYKFCEEIGIDLKGLEATTTSPVRPVDLFAGSASISEPGFDGGG
jgi:hypothetical protein